MRNISLFVRLVAVVGICCVLPAAFAAPPAATPPQSAPKDALYYVNFNKDTVGAAPELAPYVAGQTDLAPETLGLGSGAGNSLVVVKALDALTDQPLKFVAAGTSDYCPQLGGALPDIRKGTVQFAWDSLISEFPAGQTANTFTFWLFGTDAKNNQGMMLTISYLVDGGAPAGFSVQGADGVTTNHPWTLKKTDHFVVVIDMDANTYTIKVNDTVLADKKVRTTALTDLTGWRFGDASAIGGGTIKFTAGLDNISIVSPAPAQH